MDLSLKELQNKLSSDKYVTNSKNLLNIYEDNVKDPLTDKEYLLFLERYIPYYKNNTMFELGIFLQN